MTFEISFDENIYRQQIQLTFNNSWKKSLTKHKKEYVTGIILFCLGTVILYGNGNIGIVFVIMGLICIINYYVKYNQYKNAKKETQKLTKEIIEKYIQNPITLWEFNDVFLRFKFYGGDYKINWENFKYYNVVDKTFFLGFNKSDNNYYTLSESEVGEENFLKIIEFVKDKIGNSQSVN
ncbi:MAG: hypothetical protein RLZZ540_1591 [Bacteroidota bacterium]|jgi:hypothetical protein